MSRRRRRRYINLAAEAEHQDWNVKVCLVKVGCGGFVANFMANFVTELRFSVQANRRIIKAQAEATKRSIPRLGLKKEGPPSGPMVEH